MQALEQKLNKGQRSKTARLTFDGEVAFGDRLTVRRWLLGNGLRILLMVDRSAPVVSYHTWFRVGSRHEKKGKTGLAHLFEHLMFNETKGLAAGEFDRLLERAGGETNAATWVDWTYYYENVPRAELPLVTRLEALRMRHLILRNKQVKSEKEVVANERRYRVDDDVDGAANEALYAAAFTKHPYHWPTIGWMRDIERFTIEDCRDFYKTYYAPSNATLVVAGDLDEAKALALLQKHYGSIPAQTVPKDRVVVEPPQKGERRLSMSFSTPTEKLLLGYRGPAFGEFDHAVLTVANEILFGGRSSRIYRRLVTKEEKASEVRGSIAPFKDPGLFEIWASARPGHKAKELLVVINEELARLAREPVREDELDKARNRLELSFIEGMETVGGKAEQVGFYDTVLGDAGRVFERLADYRSVTREHIQAAAKKYFRTSARTTMLIKPDPKKAATAPDDAAVEGDVE